ncbi:Histone acetyltransferase [Dimargaris verticillata]|uniref:Histone acetyltransferase ESA1 n=1 Tax=Dimargaris verticillata TaxID=2761393 RepID=A0A9W8EF00_9FUNG|nr:Histone acetyltransferase [Dimargaris verticillata]
MTRATSTKSPKPTVASPQASEADTAVGTDGLVHTDDYDQIRVGCKVFVEKSVNPAEPEYRKAEILSIRKVKAPRTRSNAPAAAATIPASDQPQWEYYVHYCEFNKRLDEWIRPVRIDLARGIEFPKVKRPRENAAPGGRTPKAPRKTGGGGPADNRTPIGRELKQASGTPGGTDLTGSSPSGATLGTPRSGEGDEETHETREGQVFSKRKEIEKLRTSGSMTQSISEISRVKNLDRVIIGKHEVEAWYFSPYPEEFGHADVVYICEFCFSYFISGKQLERHRYHCTLTHPPGNEIYRHEDLSFFEIDGRRQKQYCRNLCLVSKLFLDHKTLYYDVDPFLFYVMTVTDEYGCHVIGYFSKEKESLDNYNLACILTLPQYQRKGYGRALIAFSYELSKAEGKIGSPEKPLSDLGLLSYRAFWSETLIDKLVQFKGEVSIDELSQMTSFTTQDILHTLQSIDALKYYRGQHIICLNETVVENYYKSLKKKRRTIMPSALKWKPPHFSAAELRYI